MLLGFPGPAPSPYLFCWVGGGNKTYWGSAVKFVVKDKETPASVNRMRGN